MIDDPRASSSAFGSPALLGGVPVWADIEESQPWPGIDPNLGAAWGDGFARLATGRLLRSEVPAAPDWGETLERGWDVWVVESARAEGEMWLLNLASGAMLEAVQVQQLVQVADADGFPRPRWSTVATLHGDAWTHSGGEVEAQGSRRGETVWRVRIPAWPGLTQEHRLLVGARSLSITAVEDRGMRGVVMIVTAVETLAREAI